MMLSLYWGIFFYEEEILLLNCSERGNISF